ncbi:MAG: hypothetical protein KA112_04910 [Alphaproteobacteria bacterium]|nr:hypothetical protein [Alphaproteobacteria bacterium]MBP7729929.1 hypothetical protein [Alphaproteobacteria bacterium]
MMNWKKERLLIGTEGLIKGLRPIFNIPNLVTQQISESLKQHRNHKRKDKNYGKA